MSFLPRLSRLLHKVREAASEPPLYLADRYPQHRIGRKSYGPVEVIAYDQSTKLSVGSHCSFAEGVKIMLGGEHRLDWVTTYPFNALDPRFSHITGHPASKGDVVIGNDVWVGRDAMILSGVTIGDGAAVAARSLVVKDVAAYGVVGGNPARLLRMRFAPETVEALRRIKWWDWDDARIEKAVPVLQSGDVAGFIRAVEEGRL